MEQEGGAEAPVEKRPGEQLIETFRREREGEEWGRERERLRGWMDGSMDGWNDGSGKGGRPLVHPELAGCCTLHRDGGGRAYDILGSVRMPFAVKC